MDSLFFLKFFILFICSLSFLSSHPYWIFFRCTELGTISRLGRCLAKNYSDNNWELVVDSVDGDPYGCFWLRTKEILDEDSLNQSIRELINSIYYWFDDDFDNYFKK